MSNILLYFQRLTRLFTSGISSNTLLLGFLLGLISFYIFLQLYNVGVVYMNFPQPFNARPLKMPVDGTLFWDENDKHHGLLPSSSSSSSIKTCENFFALWPSDCVDKNEELHEKLLLFSAQMLAMNTSLTLFTTGDKGCLEFNAIPHISITTFNSTQILQECGFVPAFAKMNTWNKSRFTRISDIMRICIAASRGMSYVDTDIHFLQLQRHLYEQAYVGAAMWSDAKNAIEITNAAFCLPKNV